MEEQITQINEFGGTLESLSEDKDGVCLVFTRPATTSAVETMTVHLNATEISIEVR